MGPKLPPTSASIPGKPSEDGWGLHFKLDLGSHPHRRNSADRAAANFQPLAGTEKFKPVQLSHAELKCDPSVRHGGGGQDTPYPNPLPCTAFDGAKVYTGQKSNWNLSLKKLILHGLEAKQTCGMPLEQSTCAAPQRCAVPRLPML